jgi:hypothetical protein
LTVWIIIGLIALAVTLLVNESDNDYESWDYQDRGYAGGLPYSEAGRRAR